MQGPGATARVSPGAGWDCATCKVCAALVGKNRQRLTVAARSKAREETYPETEEVSLASGLQQGGAASQREISDPQAFALR